MLYKKERLRRQIERSAAVFCYGGRRQGRFLCLSDGRKHVVVSERETKEPSPVSDICQERIGKHMKKRIRILEIVALVSLLGTALAGPVSAESRKDAADIVEDNQAVEAGASEFASIEITKHTEYPVTIKTYGSDGAEIETVYEQAPQKAAAVYQGSIETLLTLGLEESMIATAGLDNEVPDDLKAAFSSVEYLDEFTPSLETMTMLDPDLILSWGSLFGENTLGDTMDWVNKGTNVYIHSNTARNDAPRTRENEYTDILNLGIIFDVQDRAEAIVDKMRQTIESVKEQTADIEEKPTVLILESYDTFWNYGADSLGGDMVTQLGGVLLDADASDLGKEDVVAANPDVIFVVYMPYAGDDPEQLRDEKLAVFTEDEAFASLSAVQNGRVVPIMLSEMYAAATRTQDGINTFAKGLYPDIEL